MSALIDTNVLVFDTFADSEFHSKASKGLDSLEKWQLPDIVFHELMWFFRSEKYEISKSRLKIEELLTHEKSVFLHSTVDDIRFALKWATYSDYNDLVILSFAKRLQIPLFTYDNDLRRKARKHGVN